MSPLSGKPFHLLSLYLLPFTDIPYRIDGIFHQYFPLRTHTSSLSLSGWWRHIHLPAKGKILCAPSNHPPRSSFLVRASQRRSNFLGISDPFNEKHKGAACRASHLRLPVATPISWLLINNSANSHPLIAGEGDNIYFLQSANTYTIGKSKYLQADPSHHHLHAHTCCGLCGTRSGTVLLQWLTVSV